MGVWRGLYLEKAQDDSYARPLALNNSVDRVVLRSRILIETLS